MTAPGTTTNTGSGAQVQTKERNGSAIPRRAFLLSTAQTGGRWLVCYPCGALLGSLGLGTLDRSKAHAEPNYYEQEDIAASALEAFRYMVTLWREELYLELYESGWATSLERVSRYEFAQRMVKLAWVPAGELDPKFLEADFQNRTMVYIGARFDFQHKFDPNQHFTKDFATLLLREGEQWRIDLVQLLRAPYA